MVIVSLQTLTKTEVGTRDWGIAMIGLTMLLFERMWTMGLWIRKAVGCFKGCLIGHPSRSVENSGTEYDLMSVGAWLKRF